MSNRNWLLAVKLKDTTNYRLVAEGTFDHAMSHAVQTAALVRGVFTFDGIGALVYTADSGDVWRVATEGELLNRFGNIVKPAPDNKWLPVGKTSKYFYWSRIWATGDVIYNATATNTPPNPNDGGYKILETLKNLKEDREQIRE